MKQLVRMAVVGMAYGIGVAIPIVTCVAINDIVIKRHNARMKKEEGKNK